MDFEFLILEEVRAEKESLHSKEDLFLKLAELELNKTYNLRFKASGGDLTEYGKAKMSKAQKLSWTPERRKKMSENRKGQIPWSKGKKFSKEHKSRMSISNLGKMRSNETRKGFQNN